MPMRLQEIHPAMVHFPIALLPATLGVDAVGRATRNKAMMEVGRTGIAVTLASVALAGVAGLLAQESVEVDENSRRKLVTHRNLNFGLLGLTALLARRRMRSAQPSIRYLAAGMAGVGVMTYSAYLGGSMVYHDGVGVEAAGGVREDEAPHLERSEAGEALRTSGRHIVTGTKHAITDLSHRELVPWLTEESADGSSRSPERQMVPTIRD